MHQRVYMYLYNSSVVYTKTWENSHDTTPLMLDDLLRSLGIDPLQFFIDTLHVPLKLIWSPG